MGAASGKLRKKRLSFAVRVAGNAGMVGFPLDFADHGQQHVVLPEHTVDGHQARETHDEIAHTTCRASDIGHVGEHDVASPLADWSTPSDFFHTSPLMGGTRSLHSPLNKSPRANFACQRDDERLASENLKIRVYAKKMTRTRPTYERVPQPGSSACFYKSHNSNNSNIYS